MHKTSLHKLTYLGHSSLIKPKEINITNVKFGNMTFWNIW